MARKIADVKGSPISALLPKKHRESTESAGTSALQSYGKGILPSATVEEARKKTEQEIRRLSTA